MYLPSLVLHGFQFSTVVHQLLKLGEAFLKGGYRVEDWKKARNYIKIAVTVRADLLIEVFEG